ncbi:TetR/AcrR family transcriptional regulator C-terminal domain-containing protein [Kribbella sp. NPDC026596]|uniref:TetR/AcrR family transcriptional regulator n=1 Tax=Kribbella sp. NPDC026596 TaxID=3155122 RepID=UPI0033F8ECB6
MATQASEPRTPLSRDRVLRAAVAIADADGLEAVTMRRIGDALGAEAMSLYYHVANKNALLDGIVDVLMDELNAVVDGDDTSGGWKAAMRRRILTARQLMLRHPWVPRLLESRTTMRPAVVLYHDGLVGLMRSGGFSYDLAHHALHALGSRALGFSQELFDPSAGAGAESERMLVDLADQLPNLVGMLSEIAHDDPDSTLGWCDDQAEFEFSLDLILDGLDRLR